MTQSPGDSNTWNQQNHLELNCVTVNHVSYQALFQSWHSRRIYSCFPEKGSMGFAIIVTSEVLRSMKLSDDEVESNQKRIPGSQGLKETCYCP